MKAQLHWDRHTAQMDTKTPQQFQELSRKVHVSQVFLITACKKATKQQLPGGSLVQKQQPWERTRTQGGRCGSREAPFLPAAGDPSQPHHCQIHLSTSDPNLDSILIKIQSR